MQEENLRVGRKWETMNFLGVALSRFCYISIQLPFLPEPFTYTSNFITMLYDGIGFSFLGR